MTDQKSKYEEAAGILLSQLCKRWKLSIEGKIIAKDVILSAIMQGASFAENEKQEEIDELEAMMQHVKTVEKEAHNAAINKVLEICKKANINHGAVSLHVMSAIEELKLKSKE